MLAAALEQNRTPEECRLDGPFAPSAWPLISAYLADVIKGKAAHALQCSCSYSSSEHDALTVLADRRLLSHPSLSIRSAEQVQDDEHVCQCFACYTEEAMPQLSEDHSPTAKACAPIMHLSVQCIYHNEALGLLQTLRYARQVRLVGLLVPAVRVRQAS